MNGRIRLSFLCVPLLVCGGLSGQMLLVDRGLPPGNLNSAAGPARANLRLEWNREDNQGFVGDVFQVGAPGEVWRIERVRTWAVPDDRNPGAALGDLYSRIALYGGLDGGSLAVLKMAELAPGASAPSTPGVTAAPAAYDSGAAYEEFGRSLPLWQIEFSNLRWTVPGGVPVAFGVMGTGWPVPGGGGANYLWFNHASAAGASYRLRMFNAAGAQEAFFDSDGQVWDKSTTINIQAWGRQLAGVIVRRAGKDFQVALRGGPGFDINRVNAASLRFGAGRAAPEGRRIDDFDRDGYIDLVLEFSAAKAGIAPDDAEACLSGARFDGVPFEGCDAAAVVGKR